MGYTKPGVTVKQVQTSVSPNLEAPSLIPCITGLGYYVVEPGEEASKKVYTSDTFSTVAAYNNSADTTLYLNLPANAVLDEDFVYAEIQTSDWEQVPVASVSADKDTKTIILASGLGTSYNGKRIQVGYRALVSGMTSYLVADSLDYLETKFGKATTYNPLVFGAYIAMMNSNSAVGVVGIEAFNDHTGALDTLSYEEVYAIAPMDYTEAGSDYETHVTAQSAEAVKHERIAILSPVDYYFKDDDDNTTNTISEVNKTNTAQYWADTSLAIGNRRIFMTPQKYFYIRKEMPIALLKQSFLEAPFSTGSFLSDHGIYAKLVSDYVYTDASGLEHKYYMGDNIDATLYSYLVTNDATKNPMTSKRRMVADIPVPMYYASAAVAGQVAGYAPEQPLTNLNVSFGETVTFPLANKFFSDAHMNIIAGGGNWLFTHRGAAVVNRHQLSTDRSSVETQEMSITKTVDFVAKFVRAGVEPYIGKYVISDAFLKLIKTVMLGQASFLKREGYVNDLKIDKIEQDSVQKDNILVTMSVSVKYPVNYIKITLQF